MNSQWLAYIHDPFFAFGEEDVAMHDRMKEGEPNVRSPEMPLLTKPPNTTPLSEDNKRTCSPGSSKENAVASPYLPR